MYVKDNSAVGDTTPVFTQCKHLIPKTDWCFHVLHF